MSFRERALRLATASRVFPNIQLAGCYEGVSQTVTVLAADEADRIRWRNSGNPLYEGREYLATTVHELTHWLDGTSTLWGQGLLVDLHNALTAWASQSEAEFWRILALHNRLNRGGHAPYYATVDQPSTVGSAALWKISFSAGVEYGVDGRPDEARPMVFVSFADINDQRICRVPLTEMALLEANAMWAELTTRMQLIETVPATDRLVERSLMSREIMRQVYTPELAVYSAAVHLVANFHHMDNLAVALDATGRLATLALNIPRRLATDIVVPSDISNRLGARVDALRQLGDPGFVFLALCLAAPRYNPAVLPATWIDEALRAAGLPPAAALAAMAADEMSALPQSLILGGTFSERGEVILKIGRENFLQRGLVPTQPLSPPSPEKERGLRLPPIVLLDESLAPFTENPIDHPLLHPLQSLAFSSAYLSWAIKFVDACRF